MSEVYSFEALETANGVEYDTIENAYGDGCDLLIGSIDSGAMLSWLDSRTESNKREAGLRLIVKSVVNKDHERLPDEKTDQTGFEKWLNIFRRKDHRKNGEIIDRILKFNGMEVKEAKNESGGTGTEGSQSA